MEKALDKMRRLCSRREYCVSDIRAKLMKELEGDAQKVETAINKLKDEKYVDDLRYATAYARDKASISGWGATKIRYMLSAKGVAKDVISEALNEVDEVKASTRLEKLLENKYKSLKDDPQWKIKLLRFALGRGYSYDEVNDQIHRFAQ
ncbi:MAG: regulatory protein RecX [Bacteroidales bacterium]|nr:regulatory protein RecX [Bacteroidales bacterium]